MTDSASNPPIREVLPHAPPMVLLDAIESWDGDRCVCLAEIRPGNPFLRDGAAPAVVALEILAQTAATWIGLQAWAKGAPVERGFVVGVPELRFEVEALREGDRLRAEVERLFDDASGLARFRGTLLRSESVVARGTFTVYRSDRLSQGEGKA